MPVQTAVKRWAEFRDVGITTRANTWMIDPSRRYDQDPVGPVVGSGA